MKRSEARTDLRRRETHNNKRIVNEAYINREYHIKHTTRIY